MYPTFPTRAVVLAMSGALLGGVLWFLIAVAADLERAIPAILVGVFAGAATRIEPRRGRIVRTATMAVTLVSLTVVQYFVVRHAVGVGLVAAGRNTPLPLFLSPAAMWFVTFGWLRVYPLDAVFWTASAAAAFLLPAGDGGRALPPTQAFRRAPD